VPARGGEPEPLNTTIGVVATDASLTKAQCAKLAGVAHDGMARAIRPAHSMFDGDTVFALATGDGPGPAPLELHAILTAAADCFTRAVVHAVLSATSVTAKNRTWPGYLDLYPSADTRLPRMPRTPLQDGRRRVRRRDLRHRQRLVRRRRVDRHGRPLHPRRNRYVWRELISAA
jgi:hypothetical protein